MNRLVLLFTTKKLTNPQISNIRGNSPTHLGQETRVADTKCLQSMKPLVLVLSGVEYLNSYSNAGPCDTSEVESTRATFHSLFSSREF